MSYWNNIHEYNTYNDLTIKKKNMYTVFNSHAYA